MAYNQNQPNTPGNRPPSQGQHRPAQSQPPQQALARTPQQAIEFNRHALTKVASKLSAVMPKHSMDPGRFMQVFSGIMQSSNLWDCTTQSLLVAAYNAAKLGLLPDPLLGHVHVIPYRNNNNGGRREAQLMLGYKGMIELARRGGKVSSVRANVVYQNDGFEFVDGLTVKLEHVPWWVLKRPEAGDRFAVYAVAMIDGEPQHRVVPKHEVEGARARSRGAANGSSPWKTDPDAMWIKTAIRRAAVLWPQSPELARALSLDEAAEDDRSQIDEEASAEILGGNAARLTPGGHHVTHGRPGGPPADRGQTMDLEQGDPPRQRDAGPPRGQQRAQGGPAADPDPYTPDGSYQDAPGTYGGPVEGYGDPGEYIDGEGYDAGDDYSNGDHEQQDDRPAAQPTPAQPQQAAAARPMSMRGQTAAVPIQQPAAPPARDPVVVPVDDSGSEHPDEAVPAGTRPPIGNSGGLPTEPMPAIDPPVAPAGDRRRGRRRGQQ